MPAKAAEEKDWSNRHWFALRNTVSWTLALLWSVYSRDYSMGCVVATSFIFSDTSGSSFDTNINRILGVGMGLGVGNVPAILILSGTRADDLTSTTSMLRIFTYFVVMFVMWTLAMYGYLAPGSKYSSACLLWAGTSEGHAAEVSCQPCGSFQAWRAVSLHDAFYYKQIYIYMCIYTHVDIYIYIHMYIHALEF